MGAARGLAFPQCGTMLGARHNHRSVRMRSLLVTREALSPRHRSRRMPSSTDVVITAAKRTPVGSFLGAFASTPAHELGRTAIVAALEQAGVAPEEVSEVILGQVLTAAQGQNPARQASMAAGVPKEVPAWGVNQVCGSGLRAVALASQAIQTGDAQHRRRRRPGEHEPFRPRPESARRHQDGRARADRHDDQGRPDRRLQRLSYGHHRRESRPSNIRSPATTRTPSPPPRRTRRRGPAPRAASATRSRR